MNKIGFSATYGFSSINEAILFAAENRFTAVELNLNIPEFYPERYDSKEREEIKLLAQEKNIVITFHAPEDVNICTKQKYILEASLKRLKECMDFAAELRGQRFTFHIGDSVNFTMFNGSMHLEDYYEQDYITILENSIKELALYGAGKIILCAENTGYFSNAKTKSIQSLLGKGLYLTWDIGHSSLRKNQEEFMKENLCFVRTAHIHDVSKGKDHSVIGTGEVDIPYFMTLLEKRDIIFIIEVRPGEAAALSYRNLQTIFYKDNQL